MLINPLTPVSALPPVTPVRPVTPQQTPMTAEALLAMAAAAAAEVTDQLGRIAGQSSAAAATPATGTSSAAATTTATAATAAAAVVPEPEPTPAVLRARAVGAAAAQAAQRQGGLAPLMADLVAARQTQVLPTPVRAALDQVLALRAPLDGAVTGQDVKRALDRSGLFLEARLAAGVAPADRPGSSRAAAPGAPPPADLKAALLVFRQVVSGWLEATPAPTPPAGPAPSAEAPKAAPGAALTAPTVPTPTPAGPPPTPATLSPSPGVMTALQLPVLEPEVGVALTTPSATPSAAPSAAAPSPTGLAQASPSPASPAAPTVSTAPPVDGEFVPTTAASTQAALVALDTPEILVLQAVATDGPETPEALDTPPRAQTAPPSPIAARPAMASASPTAPRLALEIPFAPPTSTLARGASPLARASAEAGSPAATPPPPYRDGPTSAQPAATASLAPGADPRAVAHHLLRETGAALARQELLQIASLPEAGPAAAPGRPVEDKGARWMFDVPFMTPQGAAVAQFEISRDGGGGGAEYEARPAVPVWRARFSLDVEPMGPVHAQIALSGERARVSLWAERPASMARLMAREPMLSTALREAELTPEVAFHAGAPRRAPAAPGKFVDQAS